MNSEDIAQQILSGSTVLGIELGSTRIKACLIGRDATEVIASGSDEWENTLEDGLWTYPLDQVWGGLQRAFAALRAHVTQTYDVELTQLAGVGISAMMHGYLAFDESDELLVPFRTWRNTNTSTASQKLSELLQFNIPLRWSIAHLYQAMLDEEVHVPRIRFMTTLAGYVHWKLTGRKVLGVGDASGMFPIAATGQDYSGDMIRLVDELVADTLPVGSIVDLLPKVLPAGADAGGLTLQGAQLLDPSGHLQAGARMCPPEGDAGTGMVATNAVAPRRGNVSAGTSIFAMVVLENELSDFHPELDVVTTPTGAPVAMVHCNNGASELAGWVGMFHRFAAAAGFELTLDEAYGVLFGESLDSSADADGVLAYNQLSGEPIVGLPEGRPLVVRSPDQTFTLGSFMRAQLYGIFATLSIGMGILEDEAVAVDQLYAHGGIFSTDRVAARFLSAALDVPVALGTTASYGGAWGIAVLSAYRVAESQKPLAEYLDEHVFPDVPFEITDPDPQDRAGYERYLQRYRSGLAIERAAVTALPRGDQPS